MLELKYTLKRNKILNKLKVSFNASIKKQINVFPILYVRVGKILLELNTKCKLILVVN